MAANLAAKGFNVQVPDLNAEAVAALTAKGAQAAGDLHRAAADAGAVITMLPAGGPVKSVLSGGSGLFQAMKPGTLAIDCSTIATEDAHQLAEEARRSARAFSTPPCRAALGVRHGLIATMLSEIMADSSGGNWVLERYNPYPGVMKNASASWG